MKACVKSGVDDHSIPFVLDPHEFANRRRNEDPVRDQVLLYLRKNLLHRLTVGVPILTRGRRTGVPMSGLVSYEEQHPSTLETLDTCVGVVRVTPLLRR